MMKASIKKGRCSEAGVASLVLLAFALPVALLFAVAVIDIARVPIARQQLRSILLGAVYQAELEAYGGIAGETALIDQYPPAGNVFTDITHGTPEVLSGTQGFLTSAMASTIAAGACQAASGQIGAQSDFLDSLGGGGLAFEFSVIRLDADGDNKASLGAVLDTHRCGDAGLSDKLDAYGGSSAATSFTAALKSEGVGVGLWPLTGSSGTYISSYWLIGVGYAQVDYLLGDMYGAEASIMEFYPRSFSAAAGIQAPLS